MPRAGVRTPGTMLVRPRSVDAAQSRNPNGIHQKTRRAKKLMPNEATASPRTWAGTSWTSIKAASGPFIPIVSAVRVRAAGGSKRRAARGGPGGALTRRVLRRWNDRWALSYGGGTARPVAAREKRPNTERGHRVPEPVPQSWE